MKARNTRALILALALFASGCTAGAPNSEKSRDEARKPKEISGQVEPAKSDDAENPAPQEELPSGFYIAETDFQFEARTSRFGIGKGRDDQLILDIDINGSDAVAHALRQNEKSGWSWIQYSPHFYLKKFPVSSTGRQKELAFKMTPAQIDRFDVGIYLGEHNAVRDVHVRILDDQIEIKGQVDLALAGRPWTPFRIKWEHKR
jgi:hypothetical protein